MAVALITGSTSGIGKELAEVYARHKCDLVLVARNKEALQKMATGLTERYNVKVSFFAIDLSVPRSAFLLYDWVIDKHSNIDVLINNAGVGMSGECLDMEIDKVVSMLNLNMIALTELTLLISRDMKQHRQGFILNVSSTAAFQPAPYLAAYAASKAYVLSFTEALHIELKPYGIHVSALCPGPTDTNWAERANMTSSIMFAGGVMQPKQVAEKAYRGLLKNKMTIVTGWTNKLMSETTRLVPRKWAALVAGKMVKP